MVSPEVVFGTPRKLPNPHRLVGRVAVLDIAFAGVTGGGFEKITQKFLRGLGDRLAAWVDHHDHEQHSLFANDPRFVLATKAEHGACPEMIHPELVRTLGPVTTIVCHSDFDGLVSAAKWTLGGVEPYASADADARAIDTRLGHASDAGVFLDRALRAEGHQIKVLDAAVAWLVSGLKDPTAHSVLVQAEAALGPIERRTEQAAARFCVYPARTGGEVAYVDVSTEPGRLDKTDLLLRGQRRAPIALVVDSQNVSIAAAFDSGLNFLEVFGLAGGMPTRVSLARSELDFALERLGVDFVR